jgi:phosphotransferase system HPr (HPr) family protein
MDVTCSLIEAVAPKCATETAIPPLPTTEQAVQQISATFVVNFDQGLHARPCALLVSKLAPFDCQVLVEANGGRASGHSIIGLLMLSAGLGSSVKFTITGHNAAEAMAAIQRLFETGFDGAYNS